MGKEANLDPPDLLESDSIYDVRAALCPIPKENFIFVYFDN